MATAFGPRTIILFMGDIAFLAFSLWFSLFLRAFALPAQSVFLAHLLPFFIIFAVSIVTFVVAGLYETRSVILARRAFSTTLLVAQTFNVGLAAGLFFLVPAFGIAPKVLLGIYLIVSFIFILIWRVGIFPWFGLQKPEQAVAIGNTPEVKELVDALGNAHRAPASVAETISPESGSLSKDIARAVVEHRARFIIADFTDPRVGRAFPEIYDFLASGIRFFDALSLYETVFGRIPLSLLNERWLAQNVSLYSRTLYDSLKRVMDIVAAVTLGSISLIFYPFIILAIKLNDGGDIFVALDRVGQDGKIIHILKFRSMTGNDRGNYGANGTTQLSVTAVGAFLRKTSLDEIPQFWNILRGDLSLIGPRPEAPTLVSLYEKNIPFYGVRHLIKPGLSGWAQIYHHNDPHHAVEVEATREKLSHDLYYLKHRSLTLDVVIVLKTLKKLITRSGV